MIELPETKTDPLKLTFDVPHLLSVDGKEKTIREGGLQEIGQECETSYSLEIPQDEPQFRVRSQNQFNVAGKIVNALNDKVEVNGVTIPPSSPSASEYRKMIGERVLYFRRTVIDQMLTRQNEGKAVYCTRRFYITVP